jgi:hypothetical protein
MLRWKDDKYLCHLYTSSGECVGNAYKTATRRWYGWGVNCPDCVYSNTLRGVKVKLVRLARKALVEDSVFKVM